MEKQSKEKAKELSNRIQFAILQSLLRFGKTTPTEGVSAISNAACNLIFDIAEKCNSRKEAFEIVIIMLDTQKELFLNQAKTEGYDLENL